jgi:YD repeat-containing protein
LRGIRSEPPAPSASPPPSWGGDGGEGRRHPSVRTLATGGTRRVTYDAAGDVTAEARPGGTYGYTYNAAGRMSEFRINGVLQASYRYDAMG